MVVKQSFCLCGGKKPLEKCCLPFIEGTALPDTPGALMRSRYSAFALNKLAYIEQTQKGPAQKVYQKEAKQSAPSVEWRQLEVLNETDKTVTFRAHYVLNGESHCYQETSLFRKVDGKWYYFKRM